MTRFLATLCCILFFMSGAEARQRHRAAPSAAPGCNVLWPCDFSYTPSVLKEAKRVQRGMQVVKAMGMGSVRIREPQERAVERRQSRRQERTAVASIPSPSAGYSIPRPMRYVGGRLICAVNVGIALAERGIKGTGSPAALSYLHWGRSAGGPVPGAVIVSSRRGGGHVAIVSRVENGVVYAWNATGGQNGWREIPYRLRVLDYRVPG